MSFMNKIRGKNRQASPSAAADTARQMQTPNAPTLQSADEQAGVRSRMEAELDTQRERRGRAAGPGA